MSYGEWLQNRCTTHHLHFDPRYHHLVSKHYSEQDHPDENSYIVMRKNPQQNILRVMLTLPIQTMFVNLLKVSTDSNSQRGAGMPLLTSL